MFQTVFISSFVFWSFLFQVSTTRRKQHEQFQGVSFNYNRKKVEYTVEKYFLSSCNTWLGYANLDTWLGYVTLYTWVGSSLVGKGSGELIQSHFEQKQWKDYILFSEGTIPEDYGILSKEEHASLIHRWEHSAGQPCVRSGAVQH